MEDYISNRSNSSNLSERNENRNPSNPDTWKEKLTGGRLALLTLAFIVLLLLITKGVSASTVSNSVSAENNFFWWIYIVFITLLLIDRLTLAFTTESSVITVNDYLSRLWSKTPRKEKGVVLLLYLYIICMIIVFGMVLLFDIGGFYELFLRRTHLIEKEQQPTGEEWITALVMYFIISLGPIFFIIITTLAKNAITEKQEIKKQQKKVRQANDLNYLFHSAGQIYLMYPGLFNPMDRV